jgi:hypothetical protein
MGKNHEGQLTKDEMIFYFEEINRRLALAGKHGEIMMVGGATLIFCYITSK